ncbi:hypothetical protein GA0115243_103553 [Streptomyces sp. ScaeMP-e83]|nr:hypothetical protein GA0115243_103553 [Streptomyces sp. ScaeMP-e83]
MVQQPLLVGDDEVRGQGEEPVGAGLLGGPCVLDREGRAVSGARDDGHLSGRLLDGGGDHEAELLPRQRVELARAAAGEDRGRARVDPGAHMGPEDVEVDGAVGPEGGHGEEERPGGFGEPGGEGG